MKRSIITTSDGSKTIQIEDWDEQYHSIHGAIQESQHVFIKTGLHHFLKLYQPNHLSILEIGFGTGLNAFLTALEAQTHKLKIQYEGVEAYPVLEEELLQLNYAPLIAVDQQDLFEALHHVSWEELQPLNSYFSLKKRQQFFMDIEDENTFDLIYFDAFGARVQPELWTEVIFKRMFKALKNKGVLVTYAAKGSVRRAMQAVGFTVERLEGPPGKREMLRASKSI
ncbi:MAG: tRNA (5-methylaminomethyl-2-thiouridine)(34)-methyltransferase MnmD [Flavobacteriaceae bacterium]|nr:tRNA (5-methylaminomethyl-2-thiouridine)(34)-methyltransferase MnmD [Flavobacteriaceae bacterium]MDG1041973.1 tRNA (5-methylaminomethyl-2-thiouridine)(34)-methyltransferase MnmD [Flavobacteriaceae bacterium]